MSMYLFGREGKNYYRNTGVDDCFSQSPNRNEPWKKRDHKGYSSFQDEVGRRRAAGIEAFGSLPLAVYGRKYTNCKGRQKQSDGNSPIWSAK
ncbi:hypothetical protein NPIL_268891 [Nephila pilipes]|uniref:Uncharacterized protein n=1 Tax=Nephila pilipes TaxID=299642 RepID=A0A8X6NUU7_NEPPI|nr:hypothetical protein NPIL_108291 [Nephila pilipes]GFT34310.1 hypothetical protein NPIL_268891 [Nephila pilipes]